jgi:hypothetical protein
MKLYTEEQLSNSMNSVRYYINHYNENVIDKIIDNHIKTLSAIELPSDDDICDEAEIIARVYYSKDRSHHLGLEEGAKRMAYWLMKKIKPQSVTDDTLSKP